MSLNEDERKTMVGLQMEGRKGDWNFSAPVAAPAENGEDGPYYLAVLIAYQLTAKSQVGVDYRGKNTVKSVQNENIPPKALIFSDFCCTFATPIDDFACLDLQH